MPPARSDALRNRDAILAATRKLLRTHAVADLKVLDVARAAGVGPATIYRAFGSKAGLLLALLDERERELQDALLRGAPPLGPGAPADARLVAFVLALHELVADEREILLAADGGTPLGAHRTGAHQAWRLHLELLLGDGPAGTATVRAELLLAMLGAQVQAHLLDDLQVDRSRLRDELQRTALLIAAR